MGELKFVHAYAGRVLDCTGVQLAGMLDELYATDDPLGDHYCKHNNSHQISVWVSLQLAIEEMLVLPHA